MIEVVFTLGEILGPILACTACFFFGVEVGRVRELKEHNAWLTKHLADIATVQAAANQMLREDERDQAYLGEGTDAD